MRLPNLNSLRMFDAAARHLNFRLAAEELHLTQGAVAQQVRRLEADLGLALFERRARGLALTDAGRNFHAPVRRALALIEDATSRLQPESTRITVSATPSFAAKWLVPRLAGFAREHPRLEVQTVASERLANFRSDDVDVAIRQGHPPFGDGLRAELLAPLELCAVCSPEHAAGRVPVTGPRDLAGYELIRDGHDLWAALFEDAGMPAPRQVLKFNQTALAMDAAANGQGIALVPRLLVARELEQGRLLELWRDRREKQGGFHVVYPASRTSDPAIRAMVDWILSEVRGAGPARAPEPA